MPDARPLRILSIDGGGTWAMIPVRALQMLYGESARGHAVLSHFDYAAANSGGSLVLAGLMADMPLSDILALFKDEATRKRLFSRLPWYHGLGLSAVLASIGVGPRYRSAAKLDALRALLGAQAQTPLEDVPVPSRNGRRLRTTFVTYDYHRQRAAFKRNYTSAAGASGTTAARVPLAEVVHASTNAPIRYFDKPAVAGGQLYWDGGLTGYNNPVLAAVVEALANDGLDAARQAAVLSLGTGTVALPQPQDARGSAPPWRSLSSPA